MSRAWIAFWMGDYQRDTQHLTLNQHGAYFLLLQHCWQHGSIPLEEGPRAAICKVDVKRWRRDLAPAINPFFDAGGRQKRATKEIEKAERISVKRSLAGKEGGTRSGISRAIAKGEAIKREANAKQTTKQETKQTGGICEPKQNSKITSSLPTAAREAPVETEEKPDKQAGSLATALPTGALARQPPHQASRADLEAAFQRKREAKPQLDEGIPEFLRRTA